MTGGWSWARLVNWLVYVSLRSEATCLGTVCRAFSKVVMPSYYRSHRGPSRFLLCLVRLSLQWLTRPWALKGLMVLILASSLFFLLLPLLSGPQVTLVLHSGIPLVVATSEDSYPNILGRDVSDSISPDLYQDVATRFRHHQGGQQGIPLKLLGLNEPPRQPECLAMIKGDKKEIAYSLQYMEENKPSRMSLSVFSQATSSCDSFIKSRGYITHSLPEEKEFPIAYAIMMYRDADQVERLLRAVYRPHNYYCIHVDAKSDQEIQDAMKGIAGCFPNILLTSRQNVVDWAQFNSLEPWIYCMQDLWKYSWRYFINLTGQEFPLKTNLQIVKILKALDGANVVDTTTYSHYSGRWYENFPPPYNIRPFKGLVFMLASRGFVGYMLHDPVAKEYLRWVSRTDFPDESFFSTLNHNPHLMVPGSYKGYPETDALHKPFIARFVNWGIGWLDSKGRYPFSWPCGGKRVRRVCIFGVSDLPLLTNRKELFANKFMIEFQPLALDCLEEWHFNMTLVEYASKLAIDTSWYHDLDIVRNQVT